MRCRASSATIRRKLTNMFLALIFACDKVADQYGSCLRSQGSANVAATSRPGRERPEAAISAPTAVLATLAQGASFGTTADVRDCYAEGGGQIDLMVLLLHEDLANLFRHRVFSQRFTLSDAIAVIANGLVLVIEIVPEHVFRLLRRAHRFGGDRRHFAEIVDLPREDQGMIELLFGVDFKLGSDIHILGAAEHLGIDYVGDDGLILAGKIFVQQLREAVAGNFAFICGGFELGHLIPPSHRTTV